LLKILKFNSLRQSAFLIFLLAWSYIPVPAQVPPGYYNGTEGLTGEELRSALSAIISDHIELTYSSLWNHFQETDKKTDGTVWDMYSDVPGGSPAYVYNFIVDQCGNYSGEGDCYNREHSFPKSWFNDAPPMVTDLFQIYPTDGYVNGQRSNYPYGEVGTASWVSTNGSKVGNNAFPGYSGIAFEPIDEYKGDFARTYFYMLTCYKDLAQSWSSPMLSGNDFAQWARNMLVQWHDQDPVSGKETERNEAAYDIQANRNPFIDHPEFADAIWGIPALTGETGPPEISLYYSNGYVHFHQLKTTGGKLWVFNLAGQEIEVFRVDDNSEAFRINLHPGFYIFSFLRDNQIFTKKIIVLN